MSSSERQSGQGGLPEDSGATVWTIRKSKAQKAFTHGQKPWHVASFWLQKEAEFALWSGERKS